ncbi:hypothetical protein ASG54_13565 [Aureimonas sp. Leaf460]|nr:hypothetical protein ASG62_02650 [Aureimonas sp. Leaf427]KQT75836.1 hypothetical protein ASG54_13565 [Aureimonas sp. Leaf460]
MSAHAFDVFQNIIVPKPQNQPSRTLQVLRALDVSNDLAVPSMLRAVDFDDKPVRRTCKINDEAGDRKRTTEADALQAMGSNGAPEPRLGIRHDHPHAASLGAAAKRNGIVAHRDMIEF